MRLTNLLAMQKGNKHGLMDLPSGLMCDEWVALSERRAHGTMLVHARATTIPKNIAGYRYVQYILDRVCRPVDPLVYPLSS